MKSPERGNDAGDVSEQEPRAEFLQKERTLLSRFRGKAGRTARVLLTFSVLALGIGTYEAVEHSPGLKGGIGKITRAIDEYNAEKDKEVNEIHHTTGVVMAKFGAPGTSFIRGPIFMPIGKKRWGLDIQVGNKTYPADVSEEEYESFKEGEEVIIDYKEGGGLQIDVLIEGVHHLSDTTDTQPNVSNPEQ